MSTASAAYSSSGGSQARPSRSWGSPLSSVPFPPWLARPNEFAQLVLMLAEHDYLKHGTAVAR